VERAVKFGIGVLALSIFVLPSLACLLPGTAMTRAEMDCCRMMGSECGHYSMAAKHPCCQRATASERFNASQVTSKYVPDEHFTAPIAGAFIAIQLFPVSADLVNSGPIGSHSPPGLHLSASTSLRI
jgi:hypothetical protein